MKMKQSNTKVAYVCDRKACEKCEDYCYHTLDITHAVNFEEIAPGKFIEKIEE